MRHGWAPGWNSGCRCDDCRDWKFRYDKFRRHQSRNGTPLTVDATGTVRRIQALVAIGWTMRDLSQRLGYSRELLRLRTQRKRVTPRTRDQIKALYAELCMTPGPSQVGATRARAKGWAVPLAWDDIDHDENPHPTDNAHLMVDEVVVLRALGGEKITANIAERREIVARWERSGRTLAELGRIQEWRVNRYKEAV